MWIAFWLFRWIIQNNLIHRSWKKNEHLAVKFINATILQYWLLFLLYHFVFLWWLFHFIVIGNDIVISNYFCLVLDTWLSYKIAINLFQYYEQTKHKIARAIISLWFSRKFIGLFYWWKQKFPWAFKKTFVHKSTWTWFFMQPFPTFLNTR